MKNRECSSLFPTSQKRIKEALMPVINMFHMMEKHLTKEEVEELCKRGGEESRVREKRLWKERINTDKYCYISESDDQRKNPLSEIERWYGAYNYFVDTRNRAVAFLSHIKGSNPTSDVLLNKEDSYYISKMEQYKEDIIRRGGCELVAVESAAGIKEALKTPPLIVVNDVVETPPLKEQRKVGIWERLFCGD